MLNRRGWRPHQLGKTCQTPSKKPWKSAEKAYLELLSVPQSQTRAKERWNRDLVRGQTEKANSRRAFTAGCSSRERLLCRNFGLRSLKACWRMLNSHYFGDRCDYGGNKARFRSQFVGLAMACRSSIWRRSLFVGPNEDAFVKYTQTKVVS
jgi:hypothetical protein